MNSQRDNPTSGVTTRQARPWKRALLISGIVLLLGFIGLVAVMPFAFPKANPTNLGKACGNLLAMVTLCVFVVSWLWFARYRIFAIVLMSLAIGLALFVCFWVRHANQYSTTAFSQAAAKGFVQVEITGRQVLRHESFGVTVSSPGADFSAQPMQQADENTYMWVFQNPTSRLSLIMSAAHLKLPTPESAGEYLRGCIKGVRNSVKNRGIEVQASKETIELFATSHSAEVEGKFGATFFCLHLIAVDSGRPGCYAVFSAMAIATDPTIARQIARSIQVGQTIWSGAR